MCKWLDKTTALVLCSALVLAACGDDDEAAPVEPEQPAAAEITPEIIALYNALIPSFEEYLLSPCWSLERRRYRRGGRRLGRQSPATNGRFEGLMRPMPRAR